jgi:Ca2+-binding EF-hand superfamily protein
MRKMFLGFALAAACGTVCIAVTTLSAFGQEPAELFDKLDANKDGVITSDEVPDDKQATFERLVRSGDANGDKKLTKDELVTGLKKLQPAADAPAATDRPAGRPGAPAGGLPNVSPKEVFGRMDKDGNGKLEKDEIPERMKENLARVDSNSDGIVDLAEFEKVAQFFGGRRPDGAPEGRPGQGGPVPGGPVLRALDADGNGEISASEIADAAKALAKLDRNGDGKLTRDEIGPPPGAPGGRPDGARPAAGGGAFAEEFLKRIQAADANGDKKISKEEAPDRLKDQFDRLDANKDGQLDAEELKEMIARMRNAGGDQPRRRPDAEPKKE